jgi:hypothetical protein
MRTTIDVGGAPLSVLRHGEAPPVLLLLHGTFWSRVWAPVMPLLGEPLPAANQTLATLRDREGGSPEPSSRTVRHGAWTRMGQNLAAPDHTSPRAGIGAP